LCSATTWKEKQDILATAAIFAKSEEIIGVDDTNGLLDRSAFGSEVVVRG